MDREYWLYYPIPIDTEVGPRRFTLASLIEASNQAVVANDWPMLNNALLLTESVIESCPALDLVDAAKYTREHVAACVQQLMNNRYGPLRATTRR